MTIRVAPLERVQISSQSEEGMRKMLIKYVGIDCKTNLFIFLKKLN
jgi:hypothetical protein